MPHPNRTIGHVWHVLGVLFLAAGFCAALIQSCPEPHLNLPPAQANPMPQVAILPRGFTRPRAVSGFGRNFTPELELGPEPSLYVSRAQESSEDQALNSGTTTMCCVLWFLLFLFVVLVVLNEKKDG